MRDGAEVGPATSRRPCKPGSSDSRGWRQPIRSFEQDVPFQIRGWGKFSQPESCLAPRQGIYPVFSCRAQQLPWDCRARFPPAKTDQWPRQAEGPEIKSTKLVSGQQPLVLEAAYPCSAGRQPAAHALEPRRSLRAPPVTGAPSSRTHQTPGSLTPFLPHIGKQDSQVQGGVGLF